MENTGASPVLSERRGRQLWLWLNRPDRLNAVSEDLYTQLTRLVESAPEGEARVLVMAGKGRAFCAGADLKAHHRGRSRDEQLKYVDLGRQATDALQQSPLPVLAAVHGYALGAGAELALSADFVVMASDAQIGFPELSLGTYVGGGITWLLPKLVGLARARALLFLGERLDGERAAEWGLVHGVAPPDELWQAAEALAARLAEGAPIPMDIAKQHLMAGGARAEASLREQQALSEVMDTDDWSEGVASFAERRDPEFKGR